MSVYVRGLHAISGCYEAYSVPYRYRPMSILSYFLYSASRVLFFKKYSKFEVIAVNRVSDVKYRQDSPRDWLETSFHP